MNRLLTPLLSGLLFGLGLMLSGMTNPANVIGFLALGPGWNPSLGFVFAGALGITVPGFLLVRQRGTRSSAENESAPSGQLIDRHLVLGSALFGLGWGISGFCPGPAIVSAGLLQGAALLFVPAFLIGGRIAEKKN